MAMTAIAKTRADEGGVDRWADLLEHKQDIESLLTATR